ncbi:MAG: HD domain-containing protein [Leptospira sp.]|nr:HD domain-containing protein [Leptospira sp.]
MIQVHQLIIPLSLSCDLANGNPAETALRTAIISIRIGERLGMSKFHISNLAYISIIRFMGCTSYSSEEASFLGNEILIRRALAHVDPDDSWEVIQNLFFKNRSGLSWKGVKNILVNSGNLYHDMAASHCDTAGLFAADLGLPSEVQKALHEFYERWDGKGEPIGLKGEEISIYARIISLAYFLELVHDRLSISELMSFVKKKMSKQFDPSLAQHIDEELFFNLSDESIAKELEKAMSAKSFASQSEEKIAEVFGKMVDLKSQFTVNHSSQVCELAIKIAESLSLDENEMDSLKLAAYLKDLGMLSIPNQIIESKSSLKISEKESIRLHPYTTMRILSPTNLPTAVSEIAGTHHERLDGSGYHRSLKDSGISKSSRVLAVADQIVAMRSNRSYRKAFSETELKKEIYKDVKDGKLCKNTVDAGLESLGYYIKKSKPKNSFGLTEREIEVLQKISQGLTNPEIAKEFKLSPRTIQHHSIHIYNKMGVSSRAGATLLAIQNGII